MPVNNLEFGNQITAWVRGTEQRMTAVMRASIQKLVSRAQDRIPVDTGFARASIEASLTQMPQADRDRPAGSSSFAYNPGAVAVVLAQARLGDTVYIGWTANYAIYLEYGHSQQAPSGFVRVSALEWPEIVREVSQEAQSRTEGYR